MWELNIKKAGCQRIGLSNCGAGEDSWESPELQGDQTSQSYRKSTLNIHWKDWCWCWSSNTLAMWCKEQTHWKRPWCWERLKAEGEEGDRGWDGWISSPIQWTWTWANFRRWWGTGKPGMLQSMKVSKSHTQLGNWTTKKSYPFFFLPESHGTWQYDSKVHQNKGTRWIKKILTQGKTCHTGYPNTHGNDRKIMQLSCWKRQNINGTEKTLEKTQTQSGQILFLLCRPNSA